MLPLVTSALSLISKTGLGERVKDKIGDWVKNRGKFGKKARAGDYNKTTDINAFAADRAAISGTGSPWPVVVGEKIKQLKDTVGPLEVQTSNTVSADKSFIGLGVLLLAALVLPRLLK